MGANNSHDTKALPKSFESDLRTAMGSGLTSEIFGLYLVYAGVKNAFFYQCEYKDLTELELDVIKRLGLSISREPYVFVTLNPVQIHENMSNAEIGTLLGYRCPNDFDEKQAEKRRVSIIETTTGVQVVGESCNSDHVWATLDYYVKFMDGAAKFFGKPYKFVLQVSGPEHVD